MAKVPYPRASRVRFPNALTEPVKAKTLQSGPIRLFFDWTPNPALIAQDLTVKQTQINDIVVPLETSRAAVAIDVERHFETEIGPDGEQWEELSADYEAKKHEAGFGGEPILTREGRMRRAATDPKAYHVAGNELFIDTTNFPVDKKGRQYWAAHQFGGRPSMATVSKRAKKPLYEITRYPGLPARPFLGLGAEGITNVIEIFDTWLENILIQTNYPSFREGAFTLRSRKTGRWAGVYQR